MIYIMEYKANKATDFLILTRFFNNDLVLLRQMMDKKYCLPDGHHTLVNQHQKTPKKDIMFFLFSTHTRGCTTICLSRRTHPSESANQNCLSADVTITQAMCQPFFFFLQNEQLDYKIMNLG